MSNHLVFHGGSALAQQCLPMDLHDTAVVGNTGTVTRCHGAIMGYHTALPSATTAVSLRFHCQAPLTVKQVTGRFKGTPYAGAGCYKIMRGQYSRELNTVDTTEN